MGAGVSAPIPTRTRRRIGCQRKAGVRAPIATQAHGYRRELGAIGAKRGRLSGRQNAPGSEPPLQHRLVTGAGVSAPIPAQAQLIERYAPPLLPGSSLPESITLPVKLVSEWGQALEY